MPDLQSPDPGRKLQEKYNLLGTTPAPFLSPELVPVVIIDDLSEQLPGAAFAIAAQDQPNAAGLQAQVALSLPIGAGVVITDIQLQLGQDAVGRLEIYQAGPTLPSAVTELWQDTRRSGAPQGVVTMGNTVGAVAEQVWATTTLTGGFVDIDLGNYVLSGTNRRLHVLQIGTNKSLYFTWRWVEREL